MSESPALALIEFASVAVGTRASDALVKKAPVTVIRAGTIQPGKYAILFGGQVAAVQESFLAGCHVGAEAVVDRVLLPEVEPTVRAAILGAVGDWSADTLAVLETPTMAATVEAADAAVKGAAVGVVQIRLGDGLGGKGLAYFSGEQADAEAAIQIACERLAPRQQQICTAIIPRWDEAVRERLAESTRFGEGW